MSFSQKHLRCLGSRLVTFAARERYGFDERVDGGETVGNSLGRAPVEGKDGSNDWVDGEETVGNSMGRAPVGRSDMGVSRGWMEGKPWE